MKYWTTREEGELKQMRNEGRTFAAIAYRLGRTERSVASRSNGLGLTKRWTRRPTHRISLKIAVHEDFYRRMQVHLHREGMQAARYIRGLIERDLGA